MTDQRANTVAFQGEPGAYSELAALEYFGAAIRTVPCKSFEDIFAMVSQGECHYGLIPIENSLAGSIHRNYDLLLRHELHLVGEYHLRVEHCLLALPKVSLNEIRQVHSHPQALAQCEASLKQLGLEAVSEADTAGSARLIQERGERQAAAVASRRAAQVYGLDILVENLEDNPANYTRFLALACGPNQEAGGEAVPQSEAASPEVPTVGEGVTDMKTSIVFSLVNHPGVLFKALSVFALREIDLTKIESRPLQGKPWEYFFYIDFAGHTGERNVQRALEHLQELATYLRVLGSYPRHHILTSKQA